MRMFTSIACVLLPVVNALAQNTLFVNQAAQGQNNGTSWQDAYSNLHDALAAAQAGDEIWLAQGTYFPAAGTNRSIYFEQKSGTRLYGGFAGTESSLTQRDWEAHPSVLDGDIGVAGDSTDNSYTLLYMDRPNAATITDGLVFQNGVAGNISGGSISPESCGGAIFIMVGGGAAYPKISNCTFLHNAALNFGGAVFAGTNATGGKLAPCFWNCRFEGNRSVGGFGGAVYVNGDNDQEQWGDFIGCTFVSNQSAGNGGAVFYGEGTRSDTLDIIDCWFEKNFSQGLGGGCYTTGRLSGNLLRVKGTSFVENKAKIGGGFCQFSDVMPMGWVSFDSCHFERNQYHVPFPLAVHYSSALSIYAGLYDPNDNNKNHVTLSRCNILDEQTQTIDVVGGLGNIDLQKNSFSNIGVAQFAMDGITTFSSNLIKNCEEPHRFYFSSTNIRVANNIFASNHLSNAIMSLNWGDTVVGNAFINNILDNPNVIGATNAKPIFFKNNIFWGNSGSSQPGSPSWKIPLGNFSAVFSNNLFDFPSCDSLPSNFICGTGNVFSADPRFVDWVVGNFRLSPCSPAINAGDKAIYDSLDILSDYLGNMRVGDGNVDIGPIESLGLVTQGEPTILPTCEGEASGAIHFAVENGCGPYLFQWAGTNGVGSDTVGLQAGSYTFTISDSQGKMTVKQVMVGVSPTPQLEETIVNATCAICADGGISLIIENGNPPYQFLWSNGSNDSIQSGLLPGDYALTLTDAVGCDYSSSYVVDYGLGIYDVRQSEILRFIPNPAYSTATLETNLPVSQLEIFNAWGQVLKSEQFFLSTSMQKISLQVEALASGDYFVLLRDESGEIIGSGKLVKR